MKSFHIKTHLRAKHQQYQVVAAAATELEHRRRGWTTEEDKKLKIFFNVRKDFFNHFGHFEHLYDFGFLCDRINSWKFPVIERSMMIIDFTNKGCLLPRRSWSREGEVGQQRRIKRWRSSTFPKWTRLSGTLHGSLRTLMWWTLSCAWSSQVATIWRTTNATAAGWFFKKDSYSDPFNFLHKNFGQNHCFVYASIQLLFGYHL